MEQIAKVTRTINEQVAEISVPRKSACGHDCSHCSGGCSEILVKTEVTAVAYNPLGAQPGDTVRVETKSGQILSIAAVVYMVPVLLFFGLYFAGHSLFASEGAALAFGGLGFVVGIVLAIVVNGIVKRRRLTSFRITEILS